MDERSLAVLARLHAACLPDSLVGALGDRYVRAFYRYVERSQKEILAVERDESGRPVAAAVLSLEPATLLRRLLLRTPLVVDLIKALPKLALKTLIRSRGAWTRPDTPISRIPSVLPQLILIFTDAAERGRGRATALIAEIERQLARRGIARYEVRTEADPANPALRFYENRGFEVQGVTVRFGTPFTVFTRVIPRTP